MHLPIKYLAAESLDYEGSGVIDVAIAADYCFTCNKEQHGEDWGKEKGMNNFRPTYRVYE